MIEAWLPLIQVVLLLLAALVLLILEFFVMSFGLLSAASLVSVIVAVYLAAQWDPRAAYATALLAVIMAIITVRWGLRRLGRSRLVPKAMIDDHAGYRHVAERLGIVIGSTGILLTPARPGGRARFSGGECDVQSLDGVLEVDTPVMVDRIDGPVIYVTTVSSESDHRSDSLSTTNSRE